MYNAYIMDIPITEARENFAEMINRAAYGHERVRLTRRGKPEAAIISAEELDYFETLEDAQDVLLAREAMADPAPSVPWSEVKTRLGL
jgi:prevent-host-death family protein